MEESTWGNRASIERRRARATLKRRSTRIRIQEARVEQRVPDFKGRSGKAGSTSGNKCNWGYGFLVELRWLG